MTKNFDNVKEVKDLTSMMANESGKEGPLSKDDEGNKQPSEEKKEKTLVTST